MSVTIPAARAAYAAGCMSLVYPSNLIDPEGFSHLLRDFVRFGDEAGGKHLTSMPEEQAQDTLVHVYWFEGSKQPDAYAALVYYTQTMRFEVVYTTGGWPDWLNEPVQRATAAAKLNA